MIDKTIHYCWFGKGKKPRVVRKCIESWRKYCPGYEIIEWNEDNFDINACDYVKEAYEHKKWAFVSDYARFSILNERGGIYLDTDVELLKPLDEFLGSKFTAFECSDSVATGLIMASEKGDELCRYMLEEYGREHFVTEDGTLNLKTVCERVTAVLQWNGLELKDETQDVMGYRIYASKYFNPTDMQTGKKNITQVTASIHHYAASWVSPYDKFRGKVFRFLARTLGLNFARRIQKVFGRKNEVNTEV